MPSSAIWYLPTITGTESGTLDGGWTFNDAQIGGYACYCTSAADGFNNSALASGSVAPSGTTVAELRYVTIPLAAQTISGTLDVLFAVRAAGTGTPIDIAWAAHVWVSVGTSNSVRGVLLNNFTDSAPWVKEPTAPTFTGFSAPQTLTPVVAQDGDCIVFELGFVQLAPTVGDNVFGAITVGLGSGASPLGVAGNTDGTTALGYLTFSTPIERLATPPSGDTCATSGAVRAACMGREATYYALKDSAATGFTALVRQADGHVATVTDTTALYGVAVGGRHCLMELPPSNISPYPDLLTCDRGTGDVIRITSEPNPATLVQQTYGLTIAPFDGCVNSDGTRLIYVDGNDLKSWNLVDDTDLGVVVTSDVPLYWPVWLPDCTLLVSTGGPGADGPVRRYRVVDGALVQSYAYSPTPFSLGQIGIAASMSLNRLWIVGAWNDAEWTEQPAALMYSLADGAQIFGAIPGIGTDADPTVVVTQPYTEIHCTPVPPEPPPPALYPVRRYMRFMLPWDDANRMKFISRLELILQPGIGIPNTDAGDPMVMLRLSKDGGKTFGNEIQMTAGALGDYTKRVYVNRLGQMRNPVVELTVSDPCNWQILSLLADMESGTS